MSLISNLPPLRSIVILISAFVAVIIILAKIIQSATSESEEKIDSEGFEKKIMSIFSKPTKTQGSKINDKVKIRGVSSTPRTIGLAVYAKDNNVQVVHQKEENEFETKTSKGTTYEILEGKPSILFGYKIDKLMSVLGLKEMETYDVPDRLITPGDNNIWFKPKAHFVKFNGVKRHFDFEGMSRVWESSFAKVHENFLETMGDIPEQYSVLNNRISGQLKIENMKSENFREFEKLKKQMDKMDAMDS